MTDQLPANPQCPPRTRESEDSVAAVGSGGIRHSARSWYIRRLLLAAFILLCLGLAGSCLVSPVGGNLWMLATSRGFQIPAESTLFTFRVTRQNEGSGEWWLYGEDANYYYSQGDRPGVSHVAISRAKAAAVPGFLPADITTWPKDLTIAHPIVP